MAIEPAEKKKFSILRSQVPQVGLPMESSVTILARLEQDADLILLIYREEFYEPNTTRKGIADIIIAKHRNGPTGEVQLTFLGQYTKFENYAPESYAEGVFR